MPNKQQRKLENQILATLELHQLDTIKKNNYRSQSVKMTLSALNPKRCCKKLSYLRRNLTASTNPAYDEHDNKRLHPAMDDSSLSSIDTSASSAGSGIWTKRRVQMGESGGVIGRNNISTLQLFKYANFRERLSLGLGVICMLYAASWQPISVFILSTMASLMGAYSRKVALLNEMACVGPANETAISSGLISLPLLNVARAINMKQLSNDTASSRSALVMEGQSRAFVGPKITTPDNPLSDTTLLNNSTLNDNSSSTTTTTTSTIDTGINMTLNLIKAESLAANPGQQPEGELLSARVGHAPPSATYNMMQTLESLIANQQQQQHHSSIIGSQQQHQLIGITHNNNNQTDSNWMSLPILEPISRNVLPLFWPTRTSEDELRDEVSIQSAAGQLFKLEERHFLRSSFEINGSAFLLAQTQLLSFFLGLSLIAWAARQQASRVKCLFFKSCLQQELNWFESRPDDAAGLGSSLNSLVARYEDGIGTKLALLCYFLGHIILFALVAFWQMAGLAAFCMPFVLLVWLVIVYLSDLQSVAIGESSMFAKRSLQLAEEIIQSIRTVFAFNGQQSEYKRFKQTQEPVYKSSLVKHLYTALNTSLSKFSIFACFACYCFYAARLFPPHANQPDGPQNRPAVLAVMRGAEVSIVNILISIPFMEALQQSRGCIACIYQIIERKSRINPSQQSNEDNDNNDFDNESWDGSLSLKQVHFSYSQRPQLAHFRRKSTRRQQQQQPVVQQEVPPTLIVSDDDDQTGDQKSISQSQTPGCKNLLAVNSQSAQVCMNHQDPSGGSEKGRRLYDDVNLPRNVRSLSDIDRDALLGSQQRILTGLSLDIKPGQSVALVGPSGSGKSTVLALVQRLYDVTEGRLLIGQRDIRQISPAWLRNQIGIVTQEPRLFDLSITENIRLGLSRQQEADWDESFIRQQVIEAATKAGAHDFIVKLPMSYETRVGSGGVQLSGGQKQRIAIARALIRRPKLLLLDECTSALDSESEAQVQVALRAASKGKTCLIVAHHLATIKHCDLIVVMERGRVVERGSHKELMKVFGLYKQLWDEQTKQRGTGCETKQQLIGPNAGQGDFSDASSGESGANSACENSSVPSSASSSIDLGQPGGGYTELLSSAMQKLKSKSGQPGSKSLLHGSSNRQLDELTEDPEDEIAELNVGSWLSDKNNKRAPNDSTSSTSPQRKPSLAESTLSQFTYDSKPIGQPEDEKVFEPHFRVQSLSFGRLWRFVELPTWASLAGVFACLLSGLILPASLIAHSYLFAAFAYKTPEDLGRYINSFGLWVLSFSALVFIISFAQIVLPGYVGERLSKQMRCKLMHALLIKPIFYFDLQINSPGGLVDRLNTHVSNIQSIAGSRVVTLLEACSTLIASGLFGFVQSPALSLFCLAFALLVLCTTMLESRLVQAEGERERQYDVQAANLMADALSNIKTITSLNGESFFIKRFSNIMLARKQSHARSLVYLRTFLTSLKFVMPAMSWSASMYFGSLLLVNGQIDLQTVFIVCPVVLFAVNDTFRALVFLPELLKAKASIKQLYQMHEEFSPQVLKNLTLAQQLLEQTALVEESSSTSPMLISDLPKNESPQPKSQRSLSVFSINKPDINTSRKRMSISIHTNRRLSTLDSLPDYMNTKRRMSLLNSLVPQAPLRGRIEFKNVAFAYPNRPQQLILDGFSLTIKPGECVALVGGSGSGKSSTVALLEKFYDYHSGQVTLDGQDLRLVKANWVRSQIGLVSQEPTLFSCSIADNIRYGDNSRHVPMDQVVEAARAANIHDFIMSLPDQYDTQLSGGASSRLSGGQRQRIAIARALVRQAPILILDEATSALDTQNENYVQEALKRSRRGRTSLIIAHRLANIKDADKIVVMRNGRIVEIGTHFELLRLPAGRYKSLWQRQETHNSPTSYLTV